MTRRLLSVVPVLLVTAAATAYLAYVGIWAVAAIGIASTVGWLALAIFDV